MAQEPVDGTRRDASPWAVGAGVLAALVVAMLVDARAGASVLAGVLAACSVVRALLPDPPLLALGVRGRWLDVTVLAGLAAVVGVLAGILPD